MKKVNTIKLLKRILDRKKFSSKIKIKFQKTQLKMIPIYQVAIQMKEGYKTQI